jgi:hypothetical protein
MGMPMLCEFRVDRLRDFSYLWWEDNSNAKRVGAVVQKMLARNG